MGYKSVGFAKWIVLAVLATSSAGCFDNGPKRKKVYVVRGTVTYRGEPAEGVELNFAPVQDSPDVTFATGISGPGGEFQLSTFKQHDGAPSGDYTVTAFWPDRRKGATKVVAAAGEELAPDRLKGEYSNPKTSKLKATVLEQPNNLKIDIK